MMDLYNQTAFECSKVVTRNYSTSFSLGIRTLDRKFHMPVYAIYGFVRFADEIVDTFHHTDKSDLLKRFREETYQAITDKISLNPILHSFQSVVNDFHIEKDLIDAFLASMEMDLSRKNYKQDGYQRYIYGSAEVVGLMCLRVFTEGDDDQYIKLREPARRLGAAFQKVNFLRDIKSDYHDRGRVYFPGIDFSHFSNSDKTRIESDIENDFREAYQGIMMLPRTSRNGVLLAYTYYQRLFDKIRRTPASQIAQQRVRIPDFRKFTILAALLFRNYLSFDRADSHNHY